jgi:hypothetical protein
MIAPFSTQVHQTVKMCRTILQYNLATGLALLFFTQFTHDPNGVFSFNLKSRMSQTLGQCTTGGKNQ